MGAAQHYTHVPGAAHWASIKQASALVREGDTHPPKEKEKEGAKRIFLIHEETHMCASLNSILETVDTPSIDNMLRQGIPSVHHSLQEEMSSQIKLTMLLFNLCCMTSGNHDRTGLEELTDM